MLSVFPGCLFRQVDFMTAKALIESMQLQGQLYDEWIEVSIFVYEMAHLTNASTANLLSAEICVNFPPPAATNLLLMASAVPDTAVAGDERLCHCVQPRAGGARSHGPRQGQHIGK